MKTFEGNYVMCSAAGKICYTEREAGIVINSCKKHIYMGGRHWAKSSHVVILNQFLAANITAKTAAIFI